MSRNFDMSLFMKKDFSFIFFFIYLSFFFVIYLLLFVNYLLLMESLETDTLKWYFLVCLFVVVFSQKL